MFIHITLAEVNFLVEPSHNALYILICMNWAQNVCKQLYIYSCLLKF